MEHDFKLVKVCVDTVFSCELSLAVKTAKETFKPFQLDTITCTRRRREREREREKEREREREREINIE